MIAALEPVVAPPGAVIIREGDVGDFFYVIESGSVSGHAVEGARTIAPPPTTPESRERSNMHDPVTLPHTLTV